jgi:DNA gyrase/topoisomerase IV subunit A
MDYLEDKGNILNLTIFPRPPAFVNRASGQFIIATFAAISIGLAYPLYHLVSSYANEAKIFALSKHDKELKEEASKYKAILGEKKAKIKTLNKELARLAQIYGGKTKTLESIYKEKVDYRLKSGIFYELAEELNKFDVHVDRIITKEDTLWISLLSSDDRKLTELIKYISDKHFDEIREIDIKVIEKDPSGEHYRGILKVEFR